MADTKERLQAGLKESMINKDSLRRDVIRGLLSAVKQVEIDGRKELNDDDVTTIVQKEAKKRRESIDEATKVGRSEIADQEKLELAIIESFLPVQLSRDEVKVIVEETIAQTGVTSAKEIGKLMGALMPKVKGLADGKLVNEVVRELLK
ncbi:MAG: GatB/YqeY domain-containing protein [Chloroflexi bacterium]|nr:GatB/YqeY domain-containing protein [Chloroflexota bacterium]MCC6894396.1 GatB/YqeY domain-containing protein [Anaerolineae bacterium]